MSLSLLPIICHILKIIDKYKHIKEQCAASADSSPHADQIVFMWYGIIT